MLKHDPCLVRKLHLEQMDFSNSLRKMNSLVESQDEQSSWLTEVLEKCMDNNQPSRMEVDGAMIDFEDFSCQSAVKQQLFYILDKFRFLIKNYNLLYE